MKKIIKLSHIKKVKYTKSINVELTQNQWVLVTNWAQRANLDPSEYMRKIVMDFLGYEHSPIN